MHLKFQGVFSVINILTSGFLTFSRAMKRNLGHKLVLCKIGRFAFYVKDKQGVKSVLRFSQM